MDIRISNLKPISSRYFYGNSGRYLTSDGHTASSQVYPQSDGFDVGRYYCIDSDRFTELRTVFSHLVNWIPLLSGTNGAVQFDAYLAFTAKMANSRRTHNIRVYCNKKNATILALRRVLKWYLRTD